MSTPTTDTGSTDPGVDATADAATADAAGTDPAASAAPVAGSVPPAPSAAGSTRAVAVALLAGVLLVGGAAWDALPLLVAVAVVQATLIFGWVLGTGLPGRIGGILIAGAAAAGADVGVSVWPHSGFSPLLATLGLALVVLFAHQLTRGVVRVRVVESLSDVGMLVAAVVSCSVYLQLEHELDGPVMTSAVTLAAVVAVMVALLTDLVWSRPRFDPAVPRGLTGVVLAVVAAAAAGTPRLAEAGLFTTARAAFVAAAVGVVVALLSVSATFVEYGTSVEPSPLGRRLRPIPIALLPIALVAPAAYLLCLMFG